MSLLLSCPGAKTKKFSADLARLRSSWTATGLLGGYLTFAYSQDQNWPWYFEQSNLLLPVRVKKLPARGFEARQFLLVKRFLAVVCQQNQNITVDVGHAIALWCWCIASTSFCFWRFFSVWRSKLWFRLGNVQLFRLVKVMLIKFIRYVVNYKREWFFESF